jgi:hypothetical protein
VSADPARRGESRPQAEGKAILLHPSPFVKSLHGSAQSLTARRSRGRTVIQPRGPFNAPPLPAPPPAPVVVVLQNGLDSYTGCQDTWLGKAYPTRNYGVNNSLPIDTYPSGTRYTSLFRFLLTTIPHPIVAAVLSIWNTDSAFTIADLQSDLHAILPANSSWIEGTKDGTTAAVGEPCWNQRVYTIANWAGQAGCLKSGTDYDASILASAIFRDGIPEWLDFTLDATIVEAQRTGVNAGFLLKAHILTGTSNRGVAASSQHATQALHPKLTVTYQPPTP